jgi:hypothetical protein
VKRLPEGFGSDARVGKAQENALLQSRRPGRTIKPDIWTTFVTGGTHTRACHAHLDAGYPVPSASCPGFQEPEGTFLSALAGGA